MHSKVKQNDTKKASKLVKWLLHYQLQINAENKLISSKHLTIFWVVNNAEVMVYK